MLSVLVFCFCFTIQNANAQFKENSAVINKEHVALIRISSQTAIGNLDELRKEIHKGLDAGLTINKVKEGLIHLHAYAGFPRSIRGLQTLMSVVEERQKNGIKDENGKEASPILTEKSKYERGKEILQQLTGVKENDVKSGYAAFAPTIEVFLKEHLFADLFERNVLTYLERELVTISVLSSIGKVEPMLKSHLTICVNLGYSLAHLQHFVEIIKQTQGEERASETEKVLAEVLKK
ncbi:carboxymuconolactone decarboxylase family protein [Sphingobacterium bovistauri]|nr:carboxymuconolactone decarboxylase [Sphingobacterium bovistauri]